jgi:hypothetical protein
VSNGSRLAPEAPTEAYGPALAAQRLRVVIVSADETFVAAARTGAAWPAVVGHCRSFNEAILVIVAERADALLTVWGPFALNLAGALRKCFGPALAPPVLCLDHRHTHPRLGVASPDRIAELTSADAARWATAFALGADASSTPPPWGIECSAPCGA